MGAAGFVHLRNHTAYSLAEGALRIPEMAAACKRMKMPACAVADTNNLFGAAEFSKYMTDAGVQPIIGAHIATDFGLPPEMTERGRHSELVLLVQNDEGYGNLIKLVSYAYIRKTDPIALPHIKLEWLREHSAGLIALTGGVAGAPGQCLALGNAPLAEEKLLALKDIFGDRLYVEIQRHGLDIEERTEEGFLDLAYRHSIPIVATNECFFTNREMYQAHDILLCITDQKFIDEDDRRRETEEHYFKSPEEMAELFSDLPEAIENTVAIARRCAYKIKKSKPLLPHVEKDADEETLILIKASEGLERRLLQAGITAPDERKKYTDRLAYEISVIVQMGFPGYFLIVADFIGWAKRNRIPVGPGRGSGAGSVVAWSLGITDLDPFQFGLLFERFLNPERVNMPDFDIDFCQDRRGEVIRYIQEKYGFDNVGQIITFGKLQTKAVIKDVGRVLRLPYLKCDDLCKMIPFRLPPDRDGKDVPVNIANCMKSVPEFKEAIENDEVLKSLISIALKLEGLYRNPSIHAAGVVIGDRPLIELVSLYKDDRTEIPVTGFNMKYVEDTGLIKYDFLGLKTLTILQKACDMVEELRGVKIDIDHIPIDDKKTYELISNANTAGVFQFESRGMQDVIRGVKPERIEDLMAITSLYRPGPMENIPLYIRRKDGEKVEHQHPLMEPILKETYGIMVYQEQVMEIAKQLAGYTMGEADWLRKVMGKKLRAEMPKQRDKFVEGCKSHNNIDERTADEIFNTMAKFAEYGFNKSHAACYAWISYQTAYMKANFMPEFMAATMTYDMTDADKLSFFADNIRQNGIKILRPDVNKSFDHFTVEDGKIRYALAAIKSVGEGAVQSIVEEREKNGDFKTMTDFIDRIDSRNINRRMIEALTKAGAFDDIETNRAKIYENVSYIIHYINSLNRDRENKQESLFSIDEVSLKRDDIKLVDASPWKPLEMLKYEHEVIGFYVSAHPLDMYENVIKLLKATPAGKVQDSRDQKRLTVAGIVGGTKAKISKAGNRFYIVSISDSTGTTDILFSEKNMSAGRTREAIESGRPVAISCDTKVSDDRMSLFGSAAECLALNTQVNGAVMITVRDADAVATIKKAADAIGPGYASITLAIEAGGRRALVALPSRYNLTAENLELLKRINGAEVSF